MKGKTTGRAGGETADVNDRHSLNHRLGWTSGRLHRGGPAPAAGSGGNTGSAPAVDDAAGPGQIQILAVQGELDLVTADSLYVRAWAAIHRHARWLLLDLTGVSFCDARGLGALVRIANDADAAGCRYGLIAPQPNVAAILRITGLDNRLPVFAAMDEIRTGRDQEHFAGNPPLEVDDVVLPGSRTNPRRDSDRR
jgi:anti-anti-sigma factor